MWDICCLAADLLVSRGIRSLAYVTVSLMVHLFCKKKPRAHTHTHTHTQARADTHAHTHTRNLARARAHRERERESEREGGGAQACARNVGSCAKPYDIHFSS